MYGGKLYRKGGTTCKRYRSDKHSFFNRTTFNPRNEFEVIFIFAYYFRQMGLNHIYMMKSNGFPDCIATDKDGRQISIEFEFLSSRYEHHKKEKEPADWIICWYDNMKTWKNVIALKDIIPQLENGTWEWPKP